MRVEGRLSAVGELPVLVAGESVTEPVKRQRTGIALVPDFGAVLRNELLQLRDGDIGAFTFRHQQLVAAWRDCQQLLQHHRHALILDRNGADFAAFAFDRNCVFPEGLLRGGGVDAEALMDAQTAEAGEVQCEDVVLPMLHRGHGQHPVELRRGPGAVYPTEAPALQIDTQLAVVRQTVLCVLHLVVEEADGRQVGLDGAGGFALFLHVEDVGHQMLAADVGELLQAVLVGEEGAEALECLVVPLLRPEAPLAVMPR